MSVESVMPSNNLILCLPNPKKLPRGQTRNLCKALLRPLLQQEKGERTIGSLACWLLKEGMGTSLFMIRAEGRGMFKGWAEEMTFIFCPPLRWWCVQGHAQYSASATGSSKVAAVCFGSFVSFAQNLSQLPMHTVIFSSVEFLSILLLEERCVQVQALQNCSKGSWVSACLKSNAVFGIHKLKSESNYWSAGKNTPCVLYTECYSSS